MKKTISIILCVVMTLSATSCRKRIKDEREGLGKLTDLSMSFQTETTTIPTDTDPVPTDTDPSTNPDSDIVDMTMTAFVPNYEIDDNNEIREIIAEKTGVRLHEEWISYMTVDEGVGAMIASGQLPDFVDGGSESIELYHQGLLVAWDDYLDEYPNLRSMYTDKQWELFRQDDGHIYWANVFDRVNGDPKDTIHDSFAFWIQIRVLEYLGYPLITTLDEYFGALEAYAEANPKHVDGKEIVPYMALMEDWRYFCVEAAPAFLDGYPHDSSVIVNTTDFGMPTIVDQNTTPTAKKYFQKLNEVYKKGMMPADFYTMNYDQYIALLCGGTVLGICDEYWDFGYTVNTEFKNNGLDQYGCEYVPLALTIEHDMPNRYHDYYGSVNSRSGIAVTTSCIDPALAFSFLSRCLDQDIHDLRFWGIEGADYLVDDEGLYYRTQDMRANWADRAYQASHCCTYSYLPQWDGTSRDGLNAMKPEEQPSEFLDTLSAPMQTCFKAYGYSTYCDFLRSEKVEPECWYPMYTYSNALDRTTPAGMALAHMDDTKHKYLPHVIKGSDFDKEWESYIKAYEDCHPMDFLDEMQEELNRRIAASS